MTGFSFLVHPPLVRPTLWHADLIPAYRAKMGCLS